MGDAMPAMSAAAAPPTRGPRRGLLVAGAVLLLVGIGLFVGAGRRLSDGVTSLAPAPGGCETVLDFDGGGTYIFFVETRGSLDDLEGTCATSDGDYEFDEAIPRVSLTLVDDGGDEVDLDRVDSPTYDGAGRQGTAVRTADLDEGGRYVLTVDTSESDVVVRVGKDPARGVGLMRTSGIAAGVLGVAAIAAAFLLRRTPPSPVATPSGPAPMWQPGQGPPPVAPPTPGQVAHPPYGGPPTGPPGQYGPTGWPGQGGSWSPPPPPPRR